MIFPILLISGFIESLLIKHKASNKFLTAVKESGRTNIRLTKNMNKAIDVGFTQHKDGLVYIKDTKNTDKSFDVADFGDKLILYSFHGGSNQQFLVAFEGFGKFNILNGNECFQYNKESPYVLLRSCNNSENQLFTFVRGNKRFKRIESDGLDFDNYSRFLDDDLEFDGMLPSVRNNRTKRRRRCDPLEYDDDDD